ncbi:transcription factor GTE3, chloroplastic isoform X1 [Capsicum galapagoense]
MASHADEELNLRKRLRWGSPIKVYTRKRRKIQINNDDIVPVSTAIAAAPPKYSKSSEERWQHRQEEEGETQLRDSSPIYFESGRDRIGSPVDLDGRDVAEDSCLPIVDPNNGGEIRDEEAGGEEAAMQRYRDGSARGRVDPEAIVEPLISRVEDRIRINLTGARSRDEIIDLRSVLEGELDQIRSLVAKVEAKELQLTTHNTSTNVGRISGFPSCAVNSYSRPEYIDNGVMNGRSLVRVNSEVGLVGLPESAPFQPPGGVVAESNNGVAEFVEKEKRTPKANQYYANSEFLLGKDRLPMESNKKLKPNGAGRKHNGQSEQGYPFGFGFGFDKHRNQVFKRCGNLLQRLLKHKHAWVFNAPVNVEALRLHDYHDIIKHPMDLGTIKTRLSQNWYKSPRDFAEDVRLVFRNAMTYNPKGHEVHVMSEELLKIFEDKWAVIEVEFNPDWRYQMYYDACLPTPPARKVHHPSLFARASVTSHVATYASQVRTLERSESMTGPADFRSKPSRVAHVGRRPVPKKPKANDPNKRDMTYEEKQRLSTHLQELPSDKLDAIVQIIKKRNATFSQQDDEIEIDIDSVDVETLWDLDRFVTNYKKNLSKQRRKVELALRARGSVQTAPVMNFAPMVAGAMISNIGENNTSAPATNAEAGRQADNASGSSSSGSSSSDSGSSSSDSDTDSSSGSESEAGH